MLWGKRDSLVIESAVALPEDSSLVPSTHVRQLTTACDSSSGVTDALFDLSRQWIHTHTHTHTHTPLIKNKLNPSWGDGLIVKTQV